MQNSDANIVCQIVVFMVATIIHNIFAMGAQYVVLPHSFASYLACPFTREDVRPWAQIVQRTNNYRTNNCVVVRKTSSVLQILQLGSWIYEASSLQKLTAACVGMRSVSFSSTYSPHLNFLRLHFPARHGSGVRLVLLLLVMTYRRSYISTFKLEDVT